MDALKEAIEIAGGQSALASRLGVSPQRVWNWINTLGHVPSKHVISVEDATGVHRTRLRPDLYPPEKDRAAG